MKGAQFPSVSLPPPLSPSRDSICHSSHLVYFLSSFLPVARAPFFPHSLIAKQDEKCCRIVLLLHQALPISAEII